MSASNSVMRLGRLVWSPLAKAGSWYNNTAKKHPFTCGVVTSGVKTSAADIFAQKVIERRDEIDWNRHAVFCAFGFTYLGAFQYWLYNIKFTQMCGPITARFGHKLTAPVKVFLDQFIHHPFCYFPVFFTLKTLVQGKPLSAAVDKYRSDVWESCKALWSVWVPAQLVNFAFVPRHMRIPMVAGVSFAWCIILSVMQGKLDTQQASEALKKAEALSQAAAAAQGPAPKPMGGPTFASRPLVANAALHEPAVSRRDAVQDA